MDSLDWKKDLPPTMQSRRDRFLLKMSNPMYYYHMSNTNGAECPFCGCTNGDHDEDCELDE